MDASVHQAKLERGRSWTSSLESGDTVFVGSAAGEPLALIEELLALPATTTPDLSVVQLPHGGAGRLPDSAHPGLRFTAIAANPTVVALGSRGAGSYLLSTIYQTASAIRSGSLPIDVALVQVSPPNSRGQFSLGLAVDFARDAVTRARFVVAQVNANVPRTQGNCLLELDDIDALVEADRALPSHPASVPDEQAAAVAARVVEIVPDEVAVEIGVGEISTGVLRGLRGHRHLTLHTGLFVEPLIPLIQSGVITDRFGRLPGRVGVANQATGDPTVVAFVHDNPTVAFMPASYTHDPVILRSQHRLHAINSAIEVDVFGRVNSEFIGGRRVGSSGGLLDFVRAAREADGARSIIALRSTTKSRQRTKVVARLSSPGTCTIDADLADVVVTEHGVAELAGATAAERVRRMIAVADPAFRDHLTSQASDLS